MSSQENDETEERETGSTMPADSVRRLGALSGNWQLSGKELMPTNTPSFTWIKTLLLWCLSGRGLSWLHKFKVKTVVLGRDIIGFLILKIELDVILEVLRYLGNWVNNEKRSFFFLPGKQMFKVSVKAVYTSPMNMRKMETKASSLTREGGYCISAPGLSAQDL